MCSICSASSCLRLRRDSKVSECSLADSTLVPGGLLFISISSWLSENLEAGNYLRLLFLFDGFTFALLEVGGEFALVFGDFLFGGFLVLRLQVLVLLAVPLDGLDQAVVVGNKMLGREALADLVRFVAHLVCLMVLQFFYVHFARHRLEPIQLKWLLFTYSQSGQKSGR